MQGCWVWLGWHSTCFFLLVPVDSVVPKLNVPWCAKGSPNEEFSTPIPNICATHWSPELPQQTSINYILDSDALLRSGFLFPAIPAIPSLSRGWLDFKRKLPQALHSSLSTAIVPGQRRWRWVVVWSWDVCQPDTCNLHSGCLMSPKRRISKHYSHCRDRGHIWSHAFSRDFRSCSQWCFPT